MIGVRGFPGATKLTKRQVEVTVTGKGDKAAPHSAPGALEAGVRDAEVAAGEQGLLFDDDVSTLPSDVGYRGPTACNAAGITYRQLDYWARTGLVEPTVRGATGSGTQRLYSFRDILLLKVIKRLLDAGISLQQIRTAVQHLRARGTDDLTRVTLMSDGASVYECTSNDEVIDLLQGGQGVFGIAIGGVWREIEGSLSELPGERASVEEESSDELSARRRARATG
jgi:DNA-binding transcriptional MerR regulator